MDLVKVNPATLAEAGHEFTLELPDGTETDVKIRVRGVNSAIVRNFGKKIYNEIKMRENMEIKRGKKPEDMTLEEAEELSVRTAAIRVLGWSNLSEGGKEIVFSKDEAERILQVYPFIREQVMFESDNILNFRPA